MAIPASILARLKALESNVQSEGGALIFEDGHAEQGNLFDVIEDLTKEGAAYLKRSPHDKVIGFQSETDESGLYQAIFQAVKDSATEDKETAK